MKVLKISSRFFCVGGLFLWSIVQLTAPTIQWPDFIVENAAFICFGSVLIAFILLLIFYFKEKNFKVVKELIYFAVTLTTLLLLIYLLNR